MHTAVCQEGSDDGDTPPIGANGLYTLTESALSGITHSDCFNGLDSMFERGPGRKSTDTKYDSITSLASREKVCSKYGGIFKKTSMSIESASYGTSN